MSSNDPVDMRSSKNESLLSILRTQIRISFTCLLGDVALSSPLLLIHFLCLMLPYFLFILSQPQHLYKLYSRWVVRIKGASDIYPNGWWVSESLSNSEGFGSR